MNGTFFQNLRPITETVDKITNYVANRDRRDFNFNATELMEILKRVENDDNIILIQLIAKRLGTTAELLRGDSRKRELNIIRYATYRVLFDDNWQKTDIGRIFNRDHSTVINGLTRFDDNFVCGIIQDRQQLKIYKIIKHIYGVWAQYVKYCDYIDYEKINELLNETGTPENAPKN